MSKRNLFLILAVVALALIGQYAFPSGTLTSGASTLTGPLTINNLTASQAIFTDASKNAVSNAISGSGNVCMSTSCVMTTPNIGSAAANGVNYCADATGSATTYTCTITGLAAYTTGMIVTFVPQTANSGASTLNITGTSTLGAKTIAVDNTTHDGLNANDLLAGGLYVLLYDGTRFVDLAGPDGAWTALPYAANTLADFSTLHAGLYRKLHNGDIQILGVSTCNGNRTITAGTTLWTMPAGYRITSGLNIMATIKDDAFADVGIDTDGTVKLRGSSFVCVQNTDFLSWNILYSIY